MSNERILIVNADDLGLSPGVNKGIFAAHEQGIVTSASLMVRWPAAMDAAAYARTTTKLSLGLHVDIGEWMYRANEWMALYEVVSAEDRKGLTEEVERQLSQFRELVGRNPTHIDSHQHVHRSQPLASILTTLSRNLGIPLRHREPTIRYEGGFYGQTGDGAPLPSGITTEALIRILTHLPAGITELGCHPGFGDDIVSMYRAERRLEVEALSDPRVRATIDAEKIHLRNFTDINRKVNS
jgi:predicted glycoside hydrolase/deacetylase ChbG (UPF0249 family)